MNLITVTVNLKSLQMLEKQIFKSYPAATSLLLQPYFAPAATAWLLQSHLGSYGHKLAIAATYWLLQPLFFFYPTATSLLLQPHLNS